MSFERRDRRLIALVDAAMARAAARSGTQLACRSGCTPCCIGPFPITQLDAWRLRHGLERLAAAAPGRAEAVRARASADVAAQAPHFPGDRFGTFHDDEERERAFCEAFEHAPCPALDPTTGTCDLYAWRPIACRTYGPPVRIGDEDLPPCRLCFTEASPAAIDAARQILDVSRREQPLTADVEAAAGRWGLTTVAFALGIEVSAPAGADRACRMSPPRESRVPRSR